MLITEGTGKGTEQGSRKGPHVDRDKDLNPGPDKDRNSNSSLVVEQVVEKDLAKAPSKSISLDLA